LNQAGAVFEATAMWSDGIAALAPYEPGEQPDVDGVVKLNTNENPYPPSPQALAAIRAAADVRLSRYPDLEARELKAVIAEVHGLTPAHVFVGNGSDEVLALAFRSLLKRSAPILLPDITYSFYRVYCDLFRIERRLVPVDGGLRIRVEDFTPPNGGVVLANPNAPTGLALERKAVGRLLAANARVPVLIDEAYVDFGAHSAVPLIGSCPNLLIVRTLSKSHALAGLRVGYALGQPALMAALERVKGCFNSYPLDRLAQAGATAALRDQAYFEATRDRIVRSRERLADALRALGFTVLPSRANFLFVRHPRIEAARMHADLRNRSILVRHFAQPRIDAFLRISVGTDEDCDRLLDAVCGVIGSV
jgi:histidinol-phosphate aminotransferase